MEQSKTIDTIAAKAPTKEDLKPYQPFGIPMLKLLFGLTVLSLAATAIYEYLL